MYIYTMLVTILLSFAECQNLWDFIGYVFTAYGSSVPEDAGLNITQLANKYGYILDEHTVTTEDGYIINFHRLYSNNKKRNGPLVFLMHGTMESSDSWLLQGPNYSFAYVLADEGFDVWIGNARGNKHSVKHTYLDYSSQEYWDFTWEQLGVYDLPAMIDYILEETEKNSLYYIGYSQGTTVGYVLLSMKPAYNKKIKIMFSLAPEAWMGNVKSPLIRFFSPALNIFNDFLSDIKIYAAGSEVYGKISSILCSKHVDCNNIMYGITGFGSKIDKLLIPIILGHMPTGSSVQQFVHYGQLVSSERFCRYDYGYKRNMEEYGQTEPPDYDLSKISTHVVLYYSDSDWLSHPLDVNTLIESLPNVLATYYLNNFTHLDYMYCAVARDVIYKTVIEKINEFEKNYVKLRI